MSLDDVTDDLVADVTLRGFTRMGERRRQIEALAATVLMLTPTVVSKYLGVSYANARKMLYRYAKTTYIGAVYEAR